MPAKRLGRKERRKLYTSLAGEVRENEVDAFILSNESVVDTAETPISDLTCRGF